MKKILLALVVCVTSVSVFAQDTVYSSSGRPISDYRKRQKEEDKGFDKSKLIFGGGLTFGIGGGITNLGVSPIIGYKFTEKFAAGIGLGYEYLSVKDYFPLQNPNNGFYESYPLRISIYTGSVWARYLVWQNIFLHAEPEMNIFTSKRPYYDNTKTPAILAKRSESFQVPRILLGGGFRQPITDRASLVLLLLYDVLQDKNYPANGLVIRFGFNVGF